MIIDDKRRYKVGIYLRLSREDDKIDESNNYHKQDSESIKNQRNILEKYIKENELTFVDEYVDDGYSGSNFDRPEFKRMITDIKLGKINMVLVKDLSRLGRNNIETNEYVDRFFPKHKVRFIAILDDVDTEVDTLGNEMAPFKILMNEYYNRITSKNIRATFKNKKSDGLFLGWKAPYGYKKSKRNKYKLEVDEESAKVVRRIFNLAKDGKGPQEIANILSKENISTPSVYANLNRGLKSSSYKLWCARTIDEMLDNQTYIGNLTQGRRKKIYGIKMDIRVPKDEWIIVENTHKPIIDKITFEQVQKIRKKTINKTICENNYLLKKFLRCKECKHAICVSKKKDRNYSYTACTYYQKYSKFGICTAHTIQYEKLEGEVLSKIRKICQKYVDKKILIKILENKNQNNNHCDKIKSQINTFESKLLHYEKYFEDIYLDLKKSNINEEQYNRLIIRLEQEKKELLYKINDLKSELSNIAKSAHKKIKYNKFINEYLSFEKPTRKLLALLIDRIEIDNNKGIDIYFNFNV